MFKKSKKTKRKIVFILCCLLYIVSFLLLGIIMGNPMLAIIPMCIFSVIAIWQLKLEEEKNNRYVLIMLGVNLFLACISMGIRAFISGDPHAVTTFITILVSLALMVALPILIVFGIAARVASTRAFCEFAGTSVVIVSLHRGTVDARPYGISFFLTQKSR